MNLINLFAEISYHLTEALVVLLFYAFFSGKREFVRTHMLRSILFILLYSLFAFWAATFIPRGIHSVCIITVTFLLLTYITKSNLSLSAVSMALSVFALFTLEFCASIIGMSFLNADMLAMQKNHQIRFTLFLLVRLLNFLAIITLYKLNLRLPGLNFLKKENKAFSYVVFQAAVIAIIIYCANQAIVLPDKVVIYNISIFIIYLVLIGISYLDYHEREKMLRLQQKLELQEGYVSNLESVISIIRSEKHDFLNHLNTLFLMAMLKKPDSLQKIEDYIRKLTNNYTSSYRFYNTGNEFVDGLLAVKSNYAYEQGIKLEVKLSTPLTEAAIEDNDLISILGNIVDNAFDALLSVPLRTARLVSISSEIRNDHFCLSIVNNGPMIPEKLKEKIFDSGFSTKNQSDKNRGFGLYITKQLVSRNKGNITVTSTEQKTEFLLVFQLKSIQTEKLVDVGT